MRTTLVLALAVSAGVACNKKKSEEQADKGGMGTQPQGSDTTATKPTEPPPPAKPTPKSGQDLAAWYLECGKKMSDNKMDDFKKDCIAADAVFHQVDDKDMKADEMASQMASMHTAFPDSKAEPQLVIVNGRNVLAVQLITGTQSGTMHMPPMPDVPATNKKMGQLFFHKLAINDENKATEAWEFFDPATMMFQLGLSPKGAPPMRAAMDKGMAGAPVIVVAADDAKEKANLETVKKSNDAFNSHKIPDILAFYADDALESDQAGGKDAKGKKEIEAGLKMFLTAFPDVKVETPNTYAAGDFVVVLGTFSGTNTGPMGKMKKTDKAVKGSYAEIVKLKDNKIAELWRFRNDMAMAAQLGLLPQPGAPPAGDKKDTGAVKKDEKGAGAAAPKKDEKKAEPVKAPEPTK